METLMNSWSIYETIFVIFAEIAKVLQVTYVHVQEER